MLFDSHTHLNSNEYCALELQALVEDIEASELDYVIDAGFDLDSSRLALDHARTYPWCYALVGVHPHDTETMTEETLEEISRLAMQEGAVGIGEIGLDFYRNRSSADRQEYWFRRQIQLANQLHLPISIHSREADRRTMEILIEEGAFSLERKSWFPERPKPGTICKLQSQTVLTGDGAHERNISGCQNGSEKTGSSQLGYIKHMQENDICTEPDARVLLHCFSGSAQLGREYIKLGATLSYAGPITYKTAHKRVEAVAATPIECMLIETDAPYLTPEPLRSRDHGVKNMAPYIEYTAQKVAEIKGLSYEEVCGITRENARRFFGL